jgi:glutamate dehydrogenase (NAD(P)+)
VSVPVLEVTWTDPVTGVKGYLVIDRLIRGLASGGFRVRKGLDLAEVAGLAQAMTRKEAVVYDPSDRYVPLGGAKGGLDLDPSAPELDDVLARFFAAIRPIIAEQWATGEDLGIHQRTLDAAASRAGLRSTVEAVFSRLEDPDAARARLDAAFAVEVDGIPLADLVGGFGVAEVALALAEHDGRCAHELTAVIQGFGSIGGAAARYLRHAGVRVVGIADRAGFLVDETGHDVEALLATRDTTGRIDRASLPPQAVEHDRDDWLALEVDLLIPAALSFVIDDTNAHQVRARWIIEGANLPVLARAEASLTARGIPVVPDFLANLGTNAWWWWVVFGDLEPSAEAAFARISTTIRRLLATVVDDAERQAVSLRTAAQALAERNAALLETHTGRMDTNEASSEHE